MKKAQKLVDAKAQKPKEPKKLHTEISCVDCGELRVVKVQDAFQVRRCVECQKKWRRIQRKRNRRERIERLLEENAKLKAELGRK